jgi:N-acetylmuramoyl-L-alanine amidase
MRAGWASAVGSWWVRTLLAAVVAAACANALAAPAGRAGSLNAQLSALGSAPTSVPNSVHVLGVRLGGDDGQTRIVIDVDRAMAARLMAAEGGPRRIVLALPGIDPATALEGGGQGLVKAWRVQGDSRGARLVLDLAGDVQITRRFLLAPSQAVGGYRYVIDVTRIAAMAAAPEAETPPTLAPPAAPPPGPPVRARTAQASARIRIASLAPPPVRRERKVVVIDAGHGGHDPGAQSPDANEKDITLAAARVLETRLERDGRYKVVMTRDTDVFIPLESRVQIARRAGADLFISLHADSAGADPDTHGASVYTLSDHGETRVTQVLGPHEWFTRTGSRAADPAVGQILLDLTQRSTLNRSALFAGLLIGRLGDTIDLLPRSHRDAGYFVLLAPDVPAVLLEMGFISCQADEARLTDRAQRATLMDAVGDAIDAYFTGQTRVASSS